MQGCISCTLLLDPSPFLSKRGNTLEAGLREPWPRRHRQKSAPGPRVGGQELTGRAASTPLGTPQVESVQWVTLAYSPLAGKPKTEFRLDSCAPNAFSLVGLA